MTEPLTDFQERALRLGSTLLQAWSEQQEYNKELETLCPDRTNPARWTEILLMGLDSEADEVLRAIGWKRHRGVTAQIPRRVPRDNLAYELADLTKYVLSLWQVWDFSTEQMLQSVLNKNIVMRQRLKQEFSPLPPEGSKVLVVDLDGTLADLRFGLWEFISGKGVEIEMAELTLHADVDFHIDYTSFQDLKNNFIESGGYGRLPIFAQAEKAVKEAIAEGVYVIVCTARPAEKYPRIWLDTLDWLAKFGLNVDELYIGSDVRIKLVLDLAEANYDVVLFDDDPEMIERALNSGTKVFISKYPYNAHLWSRSPGSTQTQSIRFPFSNGSPTEASGAISEGDRKESGFVPREKRAV